MSDLVPYRRGALSKMERRQAELRLSKLQHDAELAKEKLRATAEIEAERGDCMMYVGRRAMKNAEFLTEYEHLLGRLSPSARDRVAALGDITCLSLAEMLSDAARKLQ